MLPAMKRPARAGFSTIALVCTLAAAGAAGAGGMACAESPPKRFDAMPKSPAWKNVDKLVAEERIEEASRAVADIRVKAPAAGNEADVTRAIIKEVELREGLHGTETAVRFLKEEPWPTGTLAHLSLELFYAHSLV